MKTKFLLLLLVFVALVSATFILIVRRGRPEGDGRPTLRAREESTPLPLAKIPAHYDSAPALSSLAPVLSPEQFDGETRDAYQVAVTIPQTLAQLPCYCHCDLGMGHKSLYSCFTDMHAANCDICVDEANLAGQLQRNNRMSPAQIRERILALYSNQ